MRKNGDIPAGTVQVRDILAYLAQDRYMGKPEAAAYTGLSVRTLEGHPEIRRFKIKKKVLLRKSDLDLWIQAHEVESESAGPQSLRSILEKAKQAVRTNSIWQGNQTHDCATRNTHAERNRAKSSRPRSGKREP